MKLLQHTALLASLMICRAVQADPEKNRDKYNWGEVKRVNEKNRDKHNWGEVKRVKEKHSKDFFKLKGVQGIGTSYDDEKGEDAFIMVHVADKSDVAGIPKEMDGIPVRVEVSGPIEFAGLTRGGEVARELQTCPVQGPGNCRPALLGVSVSHMDRGTGTLGARVVDSNGGVYVLSCNHVIGVLPNPTFTPAQLGDYTLQPGVGDGGDACCVDDDIIGELWDWKDFKFDDTCNYIDAAIAYTHPSLVGTSTTGGWTPTSATTSAYVGMFVKKCGRTTGCTTGYIQSVDFEFVLTTIAGKARFCNQIVVMNPDDDFSAPGDSGSLVVGFRPQDLNKPVGLLFAATPVELGNMRTYLNPIDTVLNEFGVTIDGA